jgi:hypothetical protein
LQFPQPVLQPPTAQAPEVQAAVPCATLQALPQVPQSLVVVSAVSQPSDTSASQLPQPLLHATWQAPLTQLGVPWLLLQTVVHELQCRGSLVMLISHPFGLRPSQLA